MAAIVGYLLLILLAPFFELGLQQIDDWLAG